ncbi:MAG: hypothetical protein U1E77_17585 [Inhella sp.]
MPRSTVGGRMQAVKAVQEQVQPVGAILAAVLDMRHEDLPRQVQATRVRLHDWLTQQREQQCLPFEAVEDFDQLLLRTPDLHLAIEFARSLLALTPPKGAQFSPLRLALVLEMPGARTEHLMQRARHLALAGDAGEWSADASQVRNSDSLLSLAWAETPQPDRLVYHAPLPHDTALDQPSLLPVLAVLPLRRRSGPAEFDVAGELFADALINQLSQFSQLHVLARRSTSELRAQASNPAAVQSIVGASHVVHGRFSVGLGRSLLIEVELFDCKREALLWQGRCQGLVDDLIHGDLELVGRCANELSLCLVQASLDAVEGTDWAALRDFERLLSASTLMYRHGDTAFERAHHLLVDLAQRHPRSALIGAWLGMWQNLRVIHRRGDPKAAWPDGHRALDRALDHDPGCALAHAVRAHQLAAIARRPPDALAHCELALRANPNEPMAWLSRCLALSSQDRGEAAVQAGLLAQKLSPLDPWAQSFDVIVGNAMLVAGRFDEGRALAQRVLQRSFHHGPALRLLTACQQALGHTDEARLSAQRLVRAVPGFTVAHYRTGHDAAHSAPAEREAEWLAAAGVPLH